MKREIIVAFISASLFCRVGCAEEPAKPDAGKPAGSPKIQFDKTVYDFGTTSLVQQLTGTFVVSNTGDAPLELKKPQPSCGCTTAGFKTEKLAPGEKTELSFTMNVGSMARGHLEKHIGVPSNDPKTPSVQLAVKAEIVSVYEFTPQFVSLGDIHLGSSTNVAIQIKRNDGKPLGLGKAEGLGTNVHAKIDPVEGKPEAGTVNIEIVADGAARRFNSQVNLFAADGKAPLLVIPVNGRIVGDVVLQPEMLSWGIGDPENWPGSLGNKATVRRVEVKGNVSDQKLQLTNVSSTLADLKVAVETSPDGRTEIVATLEKAPSKSETGTIKFETNSKNQPTIEIPVIINVINTPKRG